MNEQLFDSQKVLRGETNRTLADYLGITEQTFSSKKKNSKSGVFTLNEMDMLRKRFGWSNNMFMAIFFPETVSKKDMTTGKLMSGQCLNRVT